MESKLQKSQNQSESQIYQKNIKAYPQDAQSVFNYHKLPTIPLKDSYLIYSPFAREFALIKRHLLNEKILLRKLKKRGFFNSNPFPQEKNTLKVGLITTTACNQKCAYCATCAEFIGNKKIYSKKLFMDEDAVILTLDKLLKKYKIEAINFMGGEPTLNMPIIKKVIDLINNKSKKTLFSIQTNGVINKEDLNYLISKGIVFSISWDGIENDKFRASSKIIKKNILKLVKKGALFKIRMTVGKWNSSNIIKSIRWLLKNGVKFIQLEPMLPEGRGSKLSDQSLTPQEFKTIFFNTLKIVEKKKCFLINYAFANLFSPKLFFCDSAAGKKIILNADGSISSCYKVQRRKDPLSENFIIGEYNFKKIKFKKSNFNVNSYPTCKKCAFYYLCSGACPFENIKSNEGVDKYLCDLRSSLLMSGILHLYSCKLKKNMCSLEGLYIMGRIAMKRKYDRLPNFMI
ncbi:MAG: radical SAM protein [Candidatus Pacearchaeota archaeon]